jgi:hypothetical protein
MKKDKVEQCKIEQDSKGHGKDDKFSEKTRWYKQDKRHSF